MKKIIFAVLVLGAFGGCVQNEDFDAFELLTDGEWILVSVLENGNETIRNCQIDNVLEFVDADDFSFSFGGDLCEDWEDDKEGTWKLKDEGTSLNFSYWQDLEPTGKAQIKEYWEIVSVTNDTLMLQDQLARDNEMNVIVETYVRN